MAPAPAGRARNPGLIMRDPYEVLGLAKSASAGEIKSTYRKLAKKFHPDQSKEPKAKDRFAEIGSAYEILGDAKKRAAYDRGEIDAEGKPRAPQFEGFGSAARAGIPAKGRNSAISISISAAASFRRAAAARSIDPDIIAELFGAPPPARDRAARARGEDVTASVTVPLAMAAGGGSVRVALPTGKTLDVAVPVGVEDGKRSGCADRDGRGRKTDRRATRSSRSAMRRIRCSKSRGATCVSICRSPSTRPCWAPRCGSPTLGGEVEMASRRARAAGASCDCAARACRPAANCRRAICWRRCASRCPPARTRT